MASQPPRVVWSFEEAAASTEFSPWQSTEYSEVILDPNFCFRGSQCLKWDVGAGVAAQAANGHSGRSRAYAFARPVIFSDLGPNDRISMAIRVSKMHKDAFTTDKAFLSLGFSLETSDPQNNNNRYFYARVQLNDLFVPGQWHLISFGLNNNSPGFVTGGNATAFDFANVSAIYLDQGSYSGVLDPEMLVYVDEVILEKAPVSRPLWPATAELPLWPGAFDSDFKQIPGRACHIQDLESISECSWNATGPNAPGTNPGALWARTDDQTTAIPNVRLNFYDNNPLNFSTGRGGFLFWARANSDQTTIRARPYADAGSTGSQQWCHLPKRDTWYRCTYPWYAYGLSNSNGTANDQIWQMIDFIMFYVTGEATEVWLDDMHMLAQFPNPYGGGGGGGGGGDDFTPPLITDVETPAKAPLTSQGSLPLTQFPTGSGSTGSSAAEVATSPGDNDAVVAGISATATILVVLLVAFFLGRFRRSRHRPAAGSANAADPMTSFSRQHQRQHGPGRSNNSNRSRSNSKSQSRRQSRRASLSRTRLHAGHSAGTATAAGAFQNAYSLLPTANVDGSTGVIAARTYDNLSTDSHTRALSHTEVAAKTYQGVPNAAGYLRPPPPPHHI